MRHLVLVICLIFYSAAGEAIASQIVIGVGQRYGQVGLMQSGASSATNTYAGFGFQGDLRFQYGALAREVTANAQGGSGSGVGLDLVALASQMYTNREAKTTIEKYTITAFGGGVDVRISALFLGVLMMQNRSIFEASGRSTNYSYLSMMTRAGFNLGLGHDSRFSVQLGGAIDYSLSSIVVSNSQTFVRNYVGFLGLCYRLISFWSPPTNNQGYK